MAPTGVFTTASRNDASLKVDAAWLEETLANKIAAVDWRQAVEDVRRFLRPAEEESLKLWGERFFVAKLSKLFAGAEPPPERARQFDDEYTPE